MCGRCCAWAGRWSTSTAPRSGRCRSGSCSTSTTPSTPCTAASNCACSMPITTNTASSRSSSSMARAASSPPSCARPSGRRAPRSAPFCAAWCARSAPTGRRPRSCCAPTAIMRARRSSTGAAPTASTSSSASRPPRPCAGMSPALEASTTARFEAAPNAGKVRRFKEFFDGAASWSRVERIIARVEAGADGADTRFIVTNLGHGNARSALRGSLLPARPGGEPHQGLEDASRRRPHLLHQGHRQPVPAVPACRRLLADVEPARGRCRKRSIWRVAQFDTLRLRLIKIAARVVEMKTQIRVHLPTACPDRPSCASSSAASRGSSHERWGADAPNTNPSRNPQTFRFELWPCRR